MAKRTAVRTIKLTIPADPAAHVARLAEEYQETKAAQREEDCDAYADLEGERNQDIDDERVKSIAGVLMGAVGTSEWDPLLAILQEIGLRMRTLQSALDGDYYDDSDMRMELHMIEQRAEAARALVTRLYPQVKSHESGKKVG